jgi:membrane-bound ClpP family serine protease
MTAKRSREATVRSWTRISRDLILTVLGVWILIHETLTPGSPDPLLVGTAMTMLGFPQAARLVAGAAKKEEEAAA